MIVNGGASWLASFLFPPRGYLSSIVWKSVCNPEVILLKSPPFAIVQFSAGEYRTMRSLNSGLEIALRISPDKRIWLTTRYLPTYRYQSGFDECIGDLSSIDASANNARSRKRGVDGWSTSGGTTSRLLVIRDEFMVTSTPPLVSTVR
jgi:hypothetical protein